MMSKRHFWNRLTVVGCLLSGWMSVAGEPDFGLSIDEEWRNIFGGEPFVLHIRVEAEQPAEGILTVAASLGSGVILRRELAWNAGTADKGGEIVIDVPAVKEGVRMSLQVQLSFRTKGNVVAKQTAEFTVFPRNPFYLGGKSLEALDLGLFDRDGKTAGIFQAAGLPFVHLKTLDACLGHDGLLVIGEGLGGRDQANVCRVARRAAASGKTVLVLMPAEASIPLDFEPETMVPGRLTLQTSRVIHRLDKKLDAHVWGGGRNSAGAVYRLVAVGNQVFAEFAKGRGPLSDIKKLEPHRSNKNHPGDPHEMELGSGQGSGQSLSLQSGWSWLEMDFPGNGRLLVVGFPIVEAWEESPTPRFLLSRLFEYVTQKERTQ